MLILSAFISLPKLGLFLIPAAGLIVLGPGLFSGQPALEREGLPVIAGLLMAIIGFCATRD